MHHNKNASIKFVAEFAGKEERERQPLQPCLCVPQNLKLLGPGAWGRSAVGRDRCGPSRRGRGCGQFGLRLKPRDSGGWLAGPAQPGPVTRGAGWYPCAFYSPFIQSTKPRAKKYNLGPYLIFCVFFIRSLAFSARGVQKHPAGVRHDHTHQLKSRLESTVPVLQTGSRLENRIASCQHCRRSPRLYAPTQKPA
jgi:hypothetical protein